MTTTFEWYVVITLCSRNDKKIQNWLRIYVVTTFLFSNFSTNGNTTLRKRCMDVVCLLGVYLDSLIKTLKQRNIACKIGNKFLGVFGYADDLTLLCPTLSGLQEMLNVCEDFAKDYNILFNASKSKLMYFGKNNLNCENLLCMSNGSSIEFVEQCVHLGTKIYSDISKKNIDNATNDLYMRTNNLMADFSYAQSSTLSVLYNSYCMNVYGSQLWCFNDYKSVERFYIAWRKTIRRIWRLDKRTHNVLINLINRCLPINLILEKRCVKYIWNLFNSSHELHKTIVKNCFYIVCLFIDKSMRLVLPIAIKVHTYK